MENNIKTNIVIDKLVKSFGENKVLDSVNLKFDGQKISCVMGESGIGKTTLLRILMGLERKDSGSIVGIDENTKMSVVFQEDRLCNNLTAFGNISMVCNKKITRAFIKNQILCILPESVIFKKVELLSGGMRQRVAIVRAMIADSDIVLMDEPFKGLDLDTKRVVIDYIKMNQRGRTMIVVTHNQSDSEMLEAPICVLTKQ